MLLPATALRGARQSVLVNTDTRVHPDPIDSRFRNVSISRASHESTVFIDDVARLNLQLNADTSKSLGFTSKLCADSQNSSKPGRRGGIDCAHRHSQQSHDRKPVSRPACMILAPWEPYGNVALRRKIEALSQLDPSRGRAGRHHSIAFSDNGQLPLGILG
jgi:hypothetical protein